LNSGNKRHIVKGWDDWEDMGGKEWMPGERGNRERRKIIDVS
jgi:hypothetical protein